MHFSPEEQAARVKLCGTLVDFLQAGHCDISSPLAMRILYKLTLCVAGMAWDGGGRRERDPII